MLRSLIALSAVAVVVLGEGYSAPPVSPPAGPSYGGSSGPSYGGSGGPSYGGSSGPSYGGPSYGGPTYGGPTYGGPGYPSSGYGGPVYYPPRDLYPDIARARARVYTLANNDDMLSSRLNGVATKINSVTDFRSRFNDEIYPSIQQGMRDQDDRIAYFRNQLQELSTLPDMVEELAARVESLLADLQDIRAARTNNLADLDRLKSAGIDQERLISNLETQIEYQERTLDEAEAKVEFSEYQANEVYDNLLVATRITDAEQAQEVVLDVTSTDPIRFEWPSAFTTTPDVFYAIQALAAEDLPDGYSQGYDLDALYASISVVADENGGTLTIDEQSVSWRFTKVQVQVYGYVISNEVIEYQSDAHNK